MATFTQHPSNLEALLERLDKLPPFALVLERCIQLLSRPYTGIAEVARWIRMDGVFSARVLQCARAEADPLQPGEMTVEEAASKLGRKTLEEIAFTFYIRRHMEGPSPALGQLWKRSLANAISAELLCGCSLGDEAAGASTSTETAYLAGLLIDSSRLLAEATGLSLAHDEHAALSAAIARAWGLPDAVCDAVRWHHQPDMAADMDLAANLNLAERIVATIFDQGEEVMSGEMFGTVPADPELLDVLHNNRRGTFETLGEYERVLAAA